MPTPFPFIGVMVTRSTAQSVTNNSFDYVVWDDTLYDTHGFWDISHANALEVPVGHAGWYVSFGKIAWSANSNDDQGVRGTGIAMTDTGENWDYQEWPNSLLTGALMWQTVQGEYRWLEEGQQISLTGYQFNTDGEALDIAKDANHPNYPSLQLVKATWLAEIP